MLWNSMVCWGAGNIGLDMINDAESIVAAQGGQVYPSNPINIENIPLAGTGRAPYYSRKFRGACNSLMCLSLVISCITNVHEYMRSDYMDKALAAVYEQEYLTWRENYEYAGFEELHSAIQNARKAAQPDAVAVNEKAVKETATAGKPDHRNLAEQDPFARDLEETITAVGAGGEISGSDK